MRRILMAHLLAASMLLMIVGTFHCNVFAAAVEIATGPDGLLQMEEQGKVTVRALRGWGRLPEKYVGLAQRMHQEAGLDLLGADLEQVKLWNTHEDILTAPYRADLIELAGFMERGEHLQWTPSAEGAFVSARTLVRSGTTRWTQATDGPATIPLASAQAEAVPNEPIQAVSVQAVTASAEPALADDGTGIEFRISDQKPGTFRARLQVEGLQEAKAEDDQYFVRMLPNVLPENSKIQKLERDFFERRADTLPVTEEWGAMGSSYDLRLGFAQANLPVVIRVDAPEDPVISVDEAEAKAGVSYKIVGKSFLYVKSSEATGSADIEYSEEVNGELRWTPRVDADTGRLVGPRAVGIYMAYRVKKFIGTSEMGTLRHDYRRIGWVVVAMPGDLYMAEGAMYAVGQDEPVTGGGDSKGAQVGVAAIFDFELPPYTIQDKTIRLTDDMRHVAWIDGEKGGKKHMVVNGVPGKWYDDVSGYPMRFSAKGELFCYKAELGEMELPVCNGAEGPLFKDLEMLTMTEDGAHILVGGEVVKDQFKVFLNGVQIRETPAKVSKGSLAFDGTAAWVESGSDQQTGSTFNRIVTSKGLEGQKYSAIHSDLVFSTNRADLYYIAEKDGGDRFLIRNEEELKPSLGSGYDFTVTADGAFYAYVAPCGENVECMITNGKIGPEYSDIWNKPLFNADGTRYAYVAKKGDDAFLVLDDKEFSHGYGSVKAIMGLTFSPDGRRWAAAFRLNDEEYVVLADGNEIGRGTGSPRRIVFSPDGNRIAWLEDKKKSWRAYVDGKAGPEVREIYDQEPPQFSPDSRHLIYFFVDGEKKMHLAVFEGEDRAHEMIPPRAMFTGSGVDYLAIDGTRFRRESISLD